LYGTGIPHSHHHTPNNHSFAQTLPVFMLFYSLFFGVGVGIAYTAPIVAGASIHACACMIREQACRFIHRLTK